MTDMQIPDENPVAPAEDWEAVRVKDLKDQFGEDGYAEILKLESKHSDPDDAVREYRRVLRSRGEGEPV